MRLSRRIWWAGLLIVLAALLSGCAMLDWYYNPHPHPTPTPSPTPTPEPTPTPTPTPTPPPQPPPQPPPTPPPPVVKPCPAPVPMDRRVMRAKPSGNGFDSTVRINDQAYCAAVTGDPSITSCKAKPEGTALDQCDKDALGGIACPVWEVSSDNTNWQRCTPDPGEFSCDHFEHWREYDPPYTGLCEKRADGFVISGWFTVIHGKGWARSCTADGLCTQAIPVDY